MKPYKIAVISSSLIVAGLVVYSVINSVKRSRAEKRLINVSEAGYETAYDVLYPQKGQSWKRSV